MLPIPAIGFQSDVERPAEPVEQEPVVQGPVGLLLLHLTRQSLGRTAISDQFVLFVVKGEHC